MSLRRLARFGLAVTVAAGSFVLGAASAAACSCGGASDAQLLEWADVVFTGELIDYSFRADADGDGLRSSADPAVWTFAVTDVWKGEALAVQPVLSPVSGASCGLEIPTSGTFHVFANNTDPTDWLEYPAGGIQANLCGGTRSVDDGALAFAEETTPTGPTETDEPPAPTTTEPPPTTGPPTPTEATSTTSPLTTTTLAVGGDAIDPVDQAAGGTVLAVGFVIVGIIGAVIAARLAKKRREEEEW